MNKQETAKRLASLHLETIRESSVNKQQKRKGEKGTIWLYPFHRKVWLFSCSGNVQQSHISAGRRQSEGPGKCIFR